MKKPVIFIYTFTKKADRTAKVLMESGFNVALPYNCEWAFEGTIKIPEEEIAKRGVIRGGLKYLKDNFDSPDVILAEEYVTAEDVLVVYGAMQEEPDALVLSERENPSGNGGFERAAYAIIRVLFTIVQGRTVHDMHSGVRGIPGQYLPVFYDMPGTDRDFLLGQIMALRRLSIKLVQCKAVTQGESPAAHSVKELLKDIVKVAMLFIKFVSSSLFSTLVDQGIYIAMLSFATDSLFWATVSARAVSSIVNFLINQYVVFRQKKDNNKRKMLIKYYMLVLPLWAVQYFTLLLFVEVLGLNRFIAYIIVGALIYVVSFLTQRDVVFKEKKL